MKRCPSCQQTYSDDISFCLMDGTALKPEIDDEISTIVREPRAPAQPSSQSRKFPLVGCSIVALLALLAVGVAAVVIFFVRDTSKDVANQTNASNTNLSAVNKQLSNLQEQQNEIERQKQELANEQKALEDQKKKPTANINAPSATDPPTSRIKFSRGSIQQTVSGSVIKRRSYVLQTLSGQFLSADVRSSGNCVVLSNGSTSQSYVTNQGDSSLTAINNCASPARFSLTVVVR
jgi:hypothetical protein